MAKILCLMNLERFQSVLPRAETETMRPFNLSRYHNGDPICTDEHSHKGLSPSRP